MTASEIRAKLENVRRRQAGISPTLDRELLMFVCEMTAEIAAQTAELNEKMEVYECHKSLAV